MSKILRLPRCPYCHKKISYIGAMFMKSKGEHTCRACSCISNVVISRVAYGVASLACVLSLLLVVMYSIGGDHSSPVGIICVLVPFLIFYLFIPFLVRLAPCKDKSAVKKLLDKSTPVISNEVFPRPVPAPVSVPVPNEGKPISLDVDEDFSAKFMRAKNHVNHKSEAELLGHESAEQQQEEIHNNEISFEINRQSPENAVDIPEEVKDSDSQPTGVAPEEQEPEP